ncbi:recombinase family protein [Burkholderia cepacia]|uniref:recombinase family protein n=1 Tax=Burkholderia cepacia TaxID=292 RepID=UPI00158C004F|nr:recombinase family protein [Burkholderia cepacia]
MSVKPRVYSYLRFSDPKQAAGGSVARQVEYASRWAVEHGMDLDMALSMRDEGLSAYHQRHVKQGAFGVFLRNVENGDVPFGSVLIVEGLDRLSRAEPILAQAQLAQIVNAGITVVTASDGREYNRERLKAQPMDLVYSLLVMIRAHEESDTKSKRVKAAIRRQCEAWIAGTWRTPIRVGRDPQWLRETEDHHFELIPERVAAVRLIIERFKQGQGAFKTVQELAVLGMAISERARTHAAHIYKLLASRTLIGEKTVEIDGEEYRLEGYYPPILSLSEFADLRTLAAHRGRRKGKGEIPGIITGFGIALCGYCGAAIVGQNSMHRKRMADGRVSPGHRRLSCAGVRVSYGCKVGGSCSAVPVERALMRYCSDQMNLTRLQEGKGPIVELSAELAQARNRVADLEGKLRRVNDALEADEGPAPSSVLRRIRDLEDELARSQGSVDGLENRLANLATRAEPAASDAWAALAAGVEQQDYQSRLQVRQLVADTFSRIVIYMHGFKPASSKKEIGLVLVTKYGKSRFLRINRKTGAWKEAEDINLRHVAASLPATRHNTA